MSTQAARIRSVEPLDGFILRLSFDDGTKRDVDLENELWGLMFEPLRADPDLFRQVRVDEVLGTIVWPNGATQRVTAVAGNYAILSRAEQKGYASVSIDWVQGHYLYTVGFMTKASTTPSATQLLRDAASLSGQLPRSQSLARERSCGLPGSSRWRNHWRAPPAMSTEPSTFAASLRDLLAAS